MKPAFYRKKWTALQKSTDKNELNHLARQIALSFLDRYFYNDHHEEEYIRILCEMATFFDDNELNNAGSSALFGIIIEGLCDDFEELQTRAYNKVMSRVVAFCMELPAGKKLAGHLKAFGLESYDDILTRIETIRSCNNEPGKLVRPPEKIILLSRVTIGADVAITSVFIQRLMHEFPNAEIIVIGGDKLKDIYGGNPHIRIREVDYSRHGSLLERFDSWFLVLEAIAKECGEKNDGKRVVFDPDSRLSQLGVLPVVRDDRYLFFNSRGKDSYPKKMSIGELTNHWMDQILGKSRFCYPRVWPPEADRKTAERFAAKLRRAGCKQIIAINFGVGGNARKRLTSEFEEKLLLNLLRTPDSVIFLDQGFGDEEISRSRFLIDSLKKRGFDTAWTTFDSLTDIRMSGGVVGVMTGIGEIASLISQCDEFIGYDSACQHIAASLGIPTYTVFAGSNNPRFIRRWSACGPAKSEIIHVDTLTHPPMFDTDDIVNRIADARSQ